MNEYKLLLLPGDGRSVGAVGSDSVLTSDHKIMRKRAR
jgi:hypothetical protein